MRLPDFTIKQLVFWLVVAAIVLLWGVALAVRLL